MTETKRSDSGKGAEEQVEEPTQSQAEPWPEAVPDTEGPSTEEPAPEESPLIEESAATDVSPGTGAVPAPSPDEPTPEKTPEKPFLIRDPLNL